MTRDNDTMPTGVTQPKPCPFCRSTNIWIGKGSPNRPVMCRGCGATANDILAWNRREPETSQSGVTQADRLAAAAELERNGRLDDASDMRRGMLDHFELVQAFARHRQPYIDALKEARVCIDQLERVARVHSETANARTLLATINELIGSDE